MMDNWADFAEARIHNPAETGTNYSRPRKDDRLGEPRACCIYDVKRNTRCSHRDHARSYFART
jgi:hypothetical protein